MCTGLTPPCGCVVLRLLARKGRWWYTHGVSCLGENCETLAPDVFRCVDVSVGPVASVADVGLVL